MQVGQSSSLAVSDAVADTQPHGVDLQPGVMLRLKPEFESDRAYRLLEVRMPVPGPGELPGPLCVLESSAGVKSYWFLSQLEVAE